MRVGVKNGGCAGMSYTMDYAESQGPLDEVVEDKGVRILVDPKAVMFLVGTEMDFKRDKLSPAVHLREPEPDGSLRLRRIRRDHAGQGRSRRTDERYAALAFLAWPRPAATSCPLITRFRPIRLAA